MYTWFKEFPFVVKTLSNLLFVSKPQCCILCCTCFVIMCNTRIKYLWLFPADNKEKELPTLCCKHFSFFPLRLKYHSNWGWQLLLKQAVYRPLFPRLYLLAFFASKMMKTVQLFKNLPPSLLMSSYHQKTLFFSSVAFVPLYLRVFPMDRRVLRITTSSFTYGHEYHIWNIYIELSIWNLESNIFLWFVLIFEGFHIVTIMLNKEMPSLLCFWL